MVRGGVTAAFLCCAFPLDLEAQPSVSYEDLIACAAEFQARYDYNRVLRLTNSDHLEYLRDRVDGFYAAAERIAPLKSGGCGSRPNHFMLLCQDTSYLYGELEKLTLDRLTRLTELNGGNYPLPLCVEDDECAKCLKFLPSADGVLRSR